MTSFICSGSLLLSFADSTGALQCSSKGTKYLEGGGGGFSFTTVFHHEYKAAQVWVATKGRFVSTQLSVCLAAGLP